MKVNGNNDSVRTRWYAPILGVLLVSAAGSVAAETAWPGFRGPSHDGSVGSQLFEGDSRALAIGWKVALGSGYSALAVGEGRVYAMFADGDSDYLGAFDSESGDELWRYRIAETYAGHDGSHDGPISTPVIADGRIYGLGPYGHLFAVDAEGKEAWATHLVDDHKATKPHYGFTSSPVFADGMLAVQIGGGEGRSIAGFKAENGELVWTLGDDAINYHSPVLATLGGEKQVISAGRNTVLGIEPTTGKVLWSYDHEGDESAMGGETIVPIPAGDDRLLLLNKFESSVMLKVGKKADAYEISELWSSDTIKRTYVQPVIHDGYIYGMTGRIFTCVDAATGERKWRSREPGDGFPTLVGNHIVMMTKPGTLHVIEASPEAYKEVAQIELFDEHSWSEVAFADGHLFARSMGHLARIDPAQAEDGGSAAASWIASTGFGAFLAGLDGAEDRKAAVDAFMAEQKSFPIIEPSAGAVHFVYRGEASDVGIVGDMIGFRREDPMTHVPGTDLFYYSTQLEPDAAVSYGFLPDYGEPIPDPLNDRANGGLFGEVSWFSMPAWQSGDFFGEASAKGRLETVEWESKIIEGPRSVQVYLPAGYDADEDRRYPVAYIHGGKEALEQGSAQAALDNLIGESVAPLIAVFVLPAEGEEGRRGPGPEYGEIVAKELVPMIDEKFRTLDDRMSRASVGTGGAAGTALMVAFGNTDLFGKVASQSATLMTPDRVAGMLKPADELAMVIYQEWGTYHLRSPHEAWDMADGNRKLWSILRDHGYRPTGGEVPEGFGWAFWKARTDELLTNLFPNQG